MADGRYNIGVDKEKRNLPNLRQAASLRPEVSEGNGTACFPTKEFLLEDSQMTSKKKRDGKSGQSFQVENGEEHCEKGLSREILVKQGKIS